MLRLVTARSLIGAGSRNAAAARRFVFTTLQYGKKTTNKVLHGHTPILGAVLALSTISHSYCDAQLVAMSSSVLVHQAHRLPKAKKVEASYLNEMINKLEKFIRYCRRFLTYLFLGLPVAIISPTAYCYAVLFQMLKNGAGIT